MRGCWRIDLKRLINSAHHSSWLSSLSSLISCASPSLFWESLPDMPSDRRYCAFGLVDVAGDPIFLVAGGNRNEVEGLHLRTCRWISFPPMHSPRSSFCGLAINKRKSFLVCGPDRTCERYDTDRKAWDDVPSMTHPRRGAACVLLPGEKVMILGGQTHK